ncbi:GNAT family N-acetyltransferase [Candidatus Uhrbacteria bacterium]|nr:GNAT family N-acetyltransferase [Candidatus Uhrbacteria bacterium]
MTIRLATDADRNAWNRYVDTHGEVPPCPRYEWRDILERAYRVTTYLFLAEDEQGAVKGICPTYVTKPWGGKPILYSLRFGLLADDAHTYATMLAHLEAFCREQGIVSYLITSGYAKCGSGTQPLIKRTLVMNTAGSGEALWNSLRNKTRNMIRKAQHAGLTVEHGFENIGIFYRIYKERMLGKHIPIHGLDFFEHLAKELKGSAELLVAKQGNVPLAGMVLLWGSHTALYPYQASSPQGERVAANQFLIWEAMRFCQAHGITSMDMGESKEGSPVYQSKLNFGGTPREIYYYSGGAGSSSGLSSLPQWLLVHAPFWIGEKMGPWIKRQGRII